MIFIEHLQDPNLHGDKYFAHPAAYEIVKQLLYDPRKGLARGKQANFNPFPLECIALIYTGVCAFQCCRTMYKCNFLRRSWLPLIHTRLEPKSLSISLEGSITLVSFTSNPSWRRYKVCLGAAKSALRKSALNSSTCST